MNIMERPHRHCDCTIHLALCAPEVYPHQCPSVIATDDGGVCVPPQETLLVDEDWVANAHPRAPVSGESNRGDVVLALEEQFVAGERTFEHIAGPPAASSLEVVRLIVRRPAAPNCAHEVFPIPTIETLTRNHFTLL